MICIDDPAAPDADGRVRELPNGPLVGNTIYNLGEPETNQTVYLDMAPGDPKQSFEVTYRNASTKTRTITIGLRDVDGDEASFVIKFFRGDTDVTDSVGEGKQFKAQPPGSTTKPLRVQVRMKGSAPNADSVSIVMRGAYGKTTPFCGDTVKASAGNLD